LVARDARPDDYDVVARLFLELRVPDPTPTAEAFEARMRPHTFLVCQEERPIAYAYWHALGDVARVIHVAVDAAEQGRGVGRALMAELARRATLAGCTRWELNVKPDNLPAIRLYERFGMRPAARTLSMRISWEDVPRLPLEEGTEAFLVAPEDEARVEGALGVLTGQIAAQRQGGGRVFVALRRDAEIVALASFDPSFPGAFPFIAPRAGVARALLEAMRPHAFSEHASVRIVAEEEEVAKAVTAAGGETLLEIVRMKGRIAEDDPGAPPL
jgi:ribosomal protein S18 acetylase RimI-like enzyme